MKHLLNTILFILVISSFSFLKGQSDHNLLWKIEGKDLTSPSYIFGTMHVNDERVFNFSDSVLLAIESCDYFATEVNMDEAVYYYFSNVFEYEPFKEEEDPFTEDEYKELEELVKLKTGKKVSKSKLRNPVLLESLLEGKGEQNGNRSTFMDAYLFGVAKTMRKQLLSLEDLNDHMQMVKGQDPLVYKTRIKKILSDSTAVLKSVLNESLIKIYEKGDLSLISSFANELIQDTFFIQRNHNMVTSILNVIEKGETIFAAAGAAHLPGTKGLVQILKEKGYTVTPVKTIYTGVADKYEIDVTKFEWVSYTNDTLGYKAQWPAKPFEADFNTVTQQMMTVDISDQSAYGVFFLGQIGLDANVDETFDRIIENYKSNNQMDVRKVRDITKGNLKGKELETLYSGYQYQRMQLFSNQGRVYLAFVGSMKDNTRDEKYKMFFESISYFNIEAIKENEKKYTYEKGAYEVRFLSKPKHHELKQQLYTGAEPIVIYMENAQGTNINEVTRYYDMALGYYIENKSDVFEETKSMLAGQSELLKDPDTIYVDGYEGRSYDLLFTGGYKAKAWTFLKGNRNYMLIAQSMSKEGEVDDRLFESFKLLPYELDVKWHKLVEIEGNNFFMPSKYVEVDPDIEELPLEYIGGKTYAGINENSGGVYMIEKYNLSKYFHVNNLDSFYTEFRDTDYSSWRDTLISSKIYEQDSVKLIDYTYTGKRDSNLYKRNYFFQIDSAVYYISSIVTKEELHDQINDQFFEKIKLTRDSEIDQNWIYESKLQLLYDEVASGDSTRSNRAEEYLASEYEITTPELDLAYQLLKLDWQDDNTSYSSKSLFTNSFYDTHDEHTIDSLKSLMEYQTPNVQAEIISSVLEIDSTAFEDYLDVLFDSAPIQGKFSDWGLLTPFEDSFALAQAYIDSLNTLLAYENYRGAVLRLYASMAEDSIYTSYISDNIESIASFTDADLNQYAMENKDSEYGTYMQSIYQRLYILSSVVAPDYCEKFTSSVLSIDKQRNYLAAVMGARLNNGLTVSAKDLKKGLQDEYSAYDIINSMLKHDRTDLLSSKMKSVENISHIVFNNYLLDVDDYAAEVVEIKKTIQFEGKNYHIIVFKYNGEEDEYIGVMDEIDDVLKLNSLQDINVYTEWDYFNSENYMDTVKKYISEMYEE